MLREPTWYESHPEYPGQGIGPKNREGRSSPQGHISDGDKETAYISLTADEELAKRWAAMSKTRYIKIDTQKVLGADGMIGDFRRGGNLDVGGGPFKIAKSTKQLLLFSNNDEYIPKDAIKGVVDYSNIPDDYQQLAKQYNKSKPKPNLPDHASIQRYTANDVSIYLHCLVD